MPFIEHENVRHWFERSGAGAPIIANHGYCESTRYWTVCGVAQRLAEQYDVVLYDLRGHGRTVVVGPPAGFDPDTMAADIDVIADALGIERFHLLSHATGGMVAARYAMERSERLLSLILTDCGSSTSPFGRLGTGGARANEVQLPPHDGTPSVDEWAMELEALRRRPGPYLRQLDDRADAEELWSKVGEVLATSNRAVTKVFGRFFYGDPDPRVERLRAIGCPTLVLLGALDSMFVEESEIVADAIPRAERVLMEGVGHMIAIEDPDATVAHLLEFLDRPSD